jgi:hypothetical protein
MYDREESLAIGKTTDMFDFCRKGLSMAATSDEWADLAKRYLKGEMARAGVKNAELAKRLTEMGLPETEGSVQVKINRGVFPAWFLLAVMRALGVTSLRLE